MTARTWTWIVYALAAVSAVVGLFARADSGPESMPLLMPLLAAAAVCAVVVLVRLLRPLLERNRGYYDAD